MTRKVWTDEDTDALRALYPFAHISVIERACNATARQIYTRAEILGLKRPQGFRQSVQGCALLRPENHVKVVRTHFKVGVAANPKGDHPNSVRFRFTAESGKASGHPIGTEVKRHGVWQRKVSDVGKRTRDWRPVHLLNWEAAHGPVPRGHRIRFIDGDRNNTHVSNLQCVSRAEVMAQNSSARYPPEVRAVLALKGHLTRTIREIEKK